jgi:Icc-related predicted phosphoesterase
LPEIPDCDLLLIGGDIVPPVAHAPSKSRVWLEVKFRPWIRDLATRMHIVGIAGNHDYIWEQHPDWVPVMDWTYLFDSSTQFGGLKIYGTPWQPYFYNWSFNLYEHDLVKKWALIPPDTDILVVHGPPHGYGDYVERDRSHAGSPGLLARIEEVKPRLVVCGHVHRGRGIYQIGPTICVNASYVDERYRPVSEPIVVEL